MQSYVDHDPGPGASDFACGPLSYDGHQGTDFSLFSLEQMHEGVAVRPAAPGRVVATRDGVEDRYYLAGTDLAGEDCGNGVLIDHGAGWRTLYCHLKEGSLRIERDQHVSRDTVLGEVGLSGRTQFPHLHMALLRNGVTFDPFRPKGRTTCSDDSVGALWRDPLRYIPGGLIAAGFAPAMPEYDTVKSGAAFATSIAPRAPALVLWAYLFGGRVDDVLEFTYTGPDDVAHSMTFALKKTQAQLYRAMGKRRAGRPWPSGPLAGTVRLIRDGAEIGRLNVTAAIAP